MDVAKRDQSLRETLEAAVTARRMAGYYQAQELQRLAEYARATEDDEFAYLEVAALLHISDRAAQQRLGLARELTERLPRTLNAVRDGRIEEFKARLIADAIRPLSDEHTTLVEDRVLGHAAEQTTAQLRAALTKAVLAVDPDGVEQRRQDKVRERRVCSQPTEDGQAVLSLYHTAARIALIRAALRGRAQQLRAEADETRTLDQIEADLAADLLLGREQALRAVEVHLTLPAATALGHDDRPANLEGVGAITAPEARELMAEATSWRWIRTHPDTGAVQDLTYPAYTPPAALATFVRVRDRTCRFPGCQRPARRCDLDHRVAWPTGPTSNANCTRLCRRHHRANTKPGGPITPPNRGSISGSLQWGWCTP
jgi:hypothetical protein